VELLFLCSYFLVWKKLTHVSGTYGMKRYVLLRVFRNHTVIKSKRPNTSVNWTSHALALKRWRVDCLSSYCPFQNYIFRNCIVTMGTRIFDRIGIGIRQADLQDVMQGKCWICVVGCQLLFYGFMTRFELFTFCLTRRQHGGTATQSCIIPTSLSAQKWHNHDSSTSNGIWMGARCGRVAGICSVRLLEKIT
jgi:hypothetical protein